MTGERLRAELERIAEGAPQVHPPSDLYARGRRATARARILAAGGAVACVALLVTLVAPTLQPDRTPVAGKPAPGVPSHIHAVPLYVDDVETDLKIGVGAAAFVTETGIPVVVSAMTGEYHLLDLDGLLAGPDTSPITLDHPPVALSPDGTQLAWGWVDQHPMEQENRERTLDVSGIRIADLETGEVRAVRVEHDSSSVQLGRLLVNQVSWSPDGRWLAWGGTWITEWTDEAFSTRNYLVGAVAPGKDRSSWAELPEPTIETDQETTAGDVPFLVAVSNDGGLSAISGNLWWRNSGQERIVLSSTQRITTLWSEGDRWFALLYSTGGDEVAMVRELPDGEDQDAYTLAPQPRMIGVLGDGARLLHQESLDGDGGVAPMVEIITTDVTKDEIGARKIIDVDVGVLGLTLASDLIDPDRPTVSRPEPDWPWSTERKLAVGGLALLGVLLLGGVALIARRLSTR
ncbi:MULTISPECIES: PD40 domain-containing protein [unclassified Nocardioides]|uniref:PD40 domain-containing protein n=1 Tax=unclassified Nocardioides TaxID=2615069 RepID=UPI0006FA9DB5|nr:MULTISPECIES: PD40 domain-containing protein [unclassified Nocardioides]KRA29911.1 hypothetical protein ASD81_19610 [Nocardioides sp. Root614]KRA86832.1 hypothetical protein ASD84_21825 [Nocardioides sp. Root682]